MLSIGRTFTSLPPNKDAHAASPTAVSAREEKARPDRPIAFMASPSVLARERGHKRTHDINRGRQQQRCTNHRKNTHHERYGYKHRNTQGFFFGLDEPCFSHLARK